MTTPQETEIQHLTAKLDSLAPDARDPWMLLQHFTASLREDDGLTFERSEEICAVERALAYSIEDDPDHYGGATLGAEFSSTDGDWPPAFEHVTDEEKTVWRVIASQTQEALLRTHFYDLVYSSNIDGAPSTGIELASMYLDLANAVHLDDYYRVACLRRAWSLSRRFSLPLERDVRQQLWEECQRLVDAEGTPPGVLLQPFAPLVVKPRTGKFEEPSAEQVQDLLKSVRETRWPYAPIIEGVTGLLEKLASTNAEKDEARRKLVEAYLALAQTQPGMAASSWYDQAYGTALKYGFTDLRDQTVSSRQDMPASALEMRSYVVEAQFPRHLADATLPRYRHAGDSRVALDLWLTSSSPTGPHEHNVETAHAAAMRPGLMQIITRSMFDADGLPIKTTSGVESLEQETLERLELMNAGARGSVIARELDVIKKNYGEPTATEVATHLVARFECDFELAEAFGEALTNFWNGKYTDAGRAAYPLVEAGARGLLLTLGDPLYRMPTENSDGRFPALYEYSKRLETHDFDIDWLRCLQNPVASFRNALAHGHLHHLKPYEAAILLRMAGLLVVLTPSGSSQTDKDEVARRLRDPIGWAAAKAHFVKRSVDVWFVDALTAEDETQA